MSLATTLPLASTLPGVSFLHLFCQLVKKEILLKKLSRADQYLFRCVASKSHDYRMGRQQLEGANHVFKMSFPRRGNDFTFEIVRIEGRG